MIGIMTCSFENVVFRDVEIDGPLWVVGTDVCKFLGYRDANKGPRLFDEDEKGTHIVTTASGDQQLPPARMYAWRHRVIKKGPGSSIH